MFALKRKNDTKLILHCSLSSRKEESGIDNIIKNYDIKYFNEINNKVFLL